MAHPLKLFSFNRVIVPIIIGLAVAIFLIAKDFSEPIISEVEFGQGEYYWIDANKDNANVNRSQVYPRLCRVQLIFEIVSKIMQIKYKVKTYFIFSFLTII